MLRHIGRGVKRGERAMKRSGAESPPTTRGSRRAGKHRDHLNAEIIVPPRFTGPLDDCSAGRLCRVLEEYIHHLRFRQRCMNSIAALQEDIPGLDRPLKKIDPWDYIVAEASAQH